MMLKSGVVDKDGDFVMGGAAAAEERKSSVFGGKKGKAHHESEDESDGDDNLSAEDLDSDDLEDEIQDNVGEMLQLQ